MATIQIRLNETDKSNIQFLRQNGYPNVSSLIKDLIEQKIYNIKNDIDNEELISSHGCVRYDRQNKELIIYDYRISTDQIGMYFDLIEPGKIRVDEKNHTLHIRI